MRWTPPPRRVLPLALAAALLAVTAPALADGAFFKGKGFAVPPEIPAQRALVVHRDGVQHLVVESTPAGDDRLLGWVIPVPARPTAVRATTAGVLDTLDVATRPDLNRHEGLLELLLLPGLLLGLGALMRIPVMRRTGGNQHVRLLVVVVGASFLGAAGLILLTPNLSAAKLGMEPVTVAGVRAGATERVGGYDVTVLEADTGAALAEWLDRSGLAALPPAGVPVADDHARRHWVFVAARLASDGPGPAAPHPLAITFPAARPIYPMRLTALAGGTTALRLHVVASGSAACPPLRARFSGAFVAREQRTAGDFTEAEHPMLAHGSWWGARAVAHPGLADLLWDGCVVTRLEGSLAPEAMDRDLEFDVGALRAMRRLLHTPGAAWREAVQVVLPWWSLAFLVLMVVAERVPAADVRWYARWAFLLTATGAVAVAGARFRMETVPAEGAARRDPTRFRHSLAAVLRETDPPPHTPPVDVARILAEQCRLRGLEHPLRGGPLRAGDSPGDVEVFEDARGPVVRTWSMEGLPLEWSWHEARLESLARGRVSGAVRLSEVAARAALFPSGEFVAGIRNPFTGEPVRRGRDAGDAEVVTTEKGAIVLRAWRRDGTSGDIVLRGN